jgi:hypothetical protein
MYWKEHWPVADTMESEDVLKVFAMAKRKTKETNGWSGKDGKCV